MTDNSKQTSDELKKKFDEIDSSFNTEESESQNSALTLERKNVEELTDDEIENIAKNSLQDYYNSGVKSLNDSNAKSISDLNSKAEKAINNFEKNKQSLADQIENAKTNAENQAIKRGIARSSIIAGQLENFDRMKIDKQTEMEKELNNQISQINYEIDSLSSRLEDSLKAFDLNYAVKLQNKINDLKEEQIKKIEKALEYNNSIALKEAEFNLKQQEKSAKSSSQTQSSLTNDVQKAKYKAAKDYFSNFSKEDALSELLNTNADYFREQLGSYYYKLYSDLKAK